MKFDYSKIPLDESSTLFGSFLLRPVIKIEIGFGKEKIPYLGLIDSGADFSIFDAQIGELLGIEVNAGIPVIFSGAEISRGSVAYIHGVDMIIGTKKLKTKVAFSYNISDSGHGLLGQIGFFEHFIVKFYYSKKEVELKAK
ncbi:MAG TPA: hypothetical protein VJJ22_00185 [Candidatus Paceibacterota bacterium]